MTDSIRRFVSLLLLVATLVSLPGPASAACPCAARRAAMRSHECPRCGDAVTPSATPRLTRANCCKTAVTDAAAAVTPASLQLDGASLAAFGQVAVLASHATAVADARAARAPPGLEARSAIPPELLRSSILRL